MCLGVCNLIPVSETDNAPLESEQGSLVCVAGRKTIADENTLVTLDLPTCLWVGLGVLVLFENSIVCQCI